MPVVGAVHAGEAVSWRRWRHGRAGAGAGHRRVRLVGAGDALLAAARLARLEAGLRKRTGDSDARVADFFDVAAGAGAGGVLAAMLFLRGPTEAEVHGGGGA